MKIGWMECKLHMNKISTFNFGIVFSLEVEVLYARKRQKRDNFSNGDGHSDVHSAPYTALKSLIENVESCSSKRVCYLDVPDFWLLQDFSTIFLWQYSEKSGLPYLIAPEKVEKVPAWAIWNVQSQEKKSTTQINLGKNFVHATHQ